MAGSPMPSHPLRAVRPMRESEHPPHALRLLRESEHPPHALWLLHESEIERDRVSILAIAFDLFIVTLVFTFW